LRASVSSTDASIGPWNLIDPRSFRRRVLNARRIEDCHKSLSHNGWVRHERPDALPKRFNCRLVAPTISCSSPRATMVPTYCRPWRRRPIRAMLAVGRVADAGWRRAISATYPSPNQRNEVHYDEDFHASGITIGAPSAVQEPRSADRTNEDKSRPYQKPRRVSRNAAAPGSSKLLVHQDEPPFL